jgi:hypothetical protein
LCLAACGCSHKDFGHGKGKDSFVCGDQTVGVVPGDGTSPKDVYLCKGDTLTWQPNGHTFVVTFPKKYPFEGNPMAFQNDPQHPNNPVVSPPAIYAGSLLYTTTILVLMAKPSQTLSLSVGAGNPRD